MVSYLNRRTILNLAFLCFSLCVILGCAKAPQKLQNSTSKTIFFSTKDFRFYDLGFVKSYPNRTTLEIFNAGTLLLQMECFQDKVCLNQTCYSKDSFMRRLLGEDSFSDLDLKAALLGEEIFEGENKQVTENGFTQMLKRGNSTLRYQVGLDSLSLRIQSTHSSFALEIHAIP